MEQTSTRRHQALQDKIDEDLRGKQTTIQYIDWLVTTVNPSPEDQRFSQGTHPSSIEFTDVSEKDEGCQSLVNTIQRHTRSSPIHCLRIRLRNDLTFGSTATGGISQQGRSLARLQQRFLNKTYLIMIMDEMSLVGQNCFFWVDRRMRHGQTAGRRVCHLDRDHAQLLPVADRPLYAPSPTTDHTQDGYAIYQLFTTVIILNHIERQNRQSQSDADFRSLLLRLRSGEITDDWGLLLSRSPNKANNSHLFDTAVRLFYDRLTVFQYNQDRLKALGRPIARINAIYSSPTAAAAQADDAGGLEPVLYLSEGAPVMLTPNLYSEAGLCNGTPGTVVSILYTDNHRPPSLPAVVLVRFPDYVGPTFNGHEQLHCVPIPPATVCTLSVVLTQLY